MRTLHSVSDISLELFAYPGNELFHIWCQLGDIPGYWYSYKCWFSEMCEMCGPDSDPFILKHSNTNNFRWVILDLWIWFVHNKRAWPWLFPCCGGVCFGGLITPQAAACVGLTVSSWTKRTPEGIQVFMRKDWAWSMGLIVHLPTWTDHRQTAEPIYSISATDTIFVFTKLTAIAQ